MEEYRQRVDDLASQLSQLSTEKSTLARLPASPALRLRIPGVKSFPLLTEQEDRARLLEKLVDLQADAPEYEARYAFSLKMVCSISLHKLVPKFESFGDNYICPAISHDVFDTCSHNSWQMQTRKCAGCV